MKAHEGTRRDRLSRRDALKLSGMAIGGLAVGRAAEGATDCTSGGCYPTDPAKTTRYSYFESLPYIRPGLPLAADEMRITFMGTDWPPPRRVQAEMSVLVEVGWNPARSEPLDTVVFDLGSGSTTNYMGMGIPYGRMNKIFICHLHGDHMNDLTQVYCFGPAADRKRPLYVWGPGPSGIVSPWAPHPVYNDGTRRFCELVREACRWHSESFSFENTCYDNQQLPTQQSWGTPQPLVPVSDDPPDDGYALYPIELDWTKVGGVAYDNSQTGVKVTHFPVVHARKGAIGYKLEWRGLSMVFTSDTKPETNCITAAKNNGRGVDVFIHEMVPPPDVMAMKTVNLPAPLPYPSNNAAWNKAVEDYATVIDSSHTLPGAFGYLLTQITPKPRLVVATHFPTADDTVECALNIVRKYAGSLRLGDDIVWSWDLMTLSVTGSGIVKRRGRIDEFTFTPIGYMEAAQKPPKYAKWSTDANGKPVIVGDPRAQLDTSTVIEAGANTYCSNGY